MGGLLFLYLHSSLAAHRRLTKDIGKKICSDYEIILFTIHYRNPSDKFERAGVSTTKWRLVWEQEDDRCMVQSCVHTSSYLFSSHQLISWCLRAFDEALLSPLFESLILNLVNEEYPGWFSFLFLSTKKLICNKRTMRYITDEILLKYTRS